MMGNKYVSVSITEATVGIEAVHISAILLSADTYSS
jgi:hypothetical protein